MEVTVYKNGNVWFTTTTFNIDGDLMKWVASYVNDGCTVSFSEFIYEDYD